MQRMRFTRPLGGKSNLLGLSLAETCIVLGVIALVLGAVWVAIRPIPDMYKQQQAVEEVTAVINNVRANLSSQFSMPQKPSGGGAGSWTNYFVKNQIIPQYMDRCPGGGCSLADNPWGQGSPIDPLGTFRVCRWITGSTDCPASEGTGGTSQIFAIQLTQLNQSNCAAVAVAVSSSASAGQGLVSAQINTTILPNVNPIPFATALGYCSAVVPNYVIFIYRLTNSSF
jgi:hypothetical protein